MKQYLFLAILFIGIWGGCKKKPKTNTPPQTVTITAETLAGKYLWVDFASDPGKTGTYSSRFTSCEVCNKFDTLNLILHGASRLIEDGAPCGSCSFSMVLTASSWSVKNNTIVSIGQDWKIAKLNDSMLELLSDPDSTFHTNKLVFKKVKPDNAPIKTYTADEVAGRYLWQQYSVDASRTNVYTDQLTSCESCNINDTLVLTKSGTSAMSEEGSPCGPCSKSMVFTAGSWGVNLNVLTIGSLNWVIKSFDNGTMQLYCDPGAPNVRMKATFKKVQ